VPSLAKVPKREEGFVFLPKRVLESKKVLHTVYTIKNKVEVTIAIESMVNQM
jgi:hypothetical protein